jgi:hypothetical protein
VGDNGVGDFILVVADELVSASRALLLVAHVIYSSRLRHAPSEERLAPNRRTPTRSAVLSCAQVVPVRSEPPTAAVQAVEPST